SPPEVAGVDFFAHGGLPVPQVTIQDAERAAASFGLTVRAQPLGSQQDSNFLLVDPAGAVAGVLKIANPALRAAESESQDGAAARVARRGGAGPGRPAGPARGVVRRGAGALLPGSAADRAGLAAAPGRHRWPGLPGHGEQRERARPRPPAGRGRGGPAAAAA